MQTILKASGGADLLALVPTLAGFHPRDSLVLLPFRGTRTSGLLRVDLPAADRAATDALSAAAATLVGHLCRLEGTDGVAIVVYDDTAADASAHRPLVDAVIGRADACGLRVIEALGLGAEHWWSYSAPPGSPDAGGARADLDRLRHGGRVASPSPSSSQSSGARLPRVDAARRRAVATALSALDAPDHARPGRRPEAPLDERLVEVFEEALANDRAADDPGTLAFLAWCLHRPALRDVAIAQWCDGPEAGADALARQRAWEGGEPYPEEGASRFLGFGPRPDLDRLRRARELCRVTAASCPPELRPGALAAAAWLSWALGSLTHAASYLARIRRIDPDHGLAGIIGAMVDAGHLPEWGFRGEG